MRVFGHRSYRQEREIEVELGNRPIRLITRPGFPGWEGISPAMQLIANKARIDAGERVLVCPCGHGALGAWAASRAGAQHVTMRDTNAVAMEMARCTCAVNGYDAVYTSTGRFETSTDSLRTRPCLPSSEAHYDVVLMLLPKGRDLARLFLLNGFNALRTGGRLYLAGPNKGGIKSALSDGAVLFGPGTVLAYKGGHRVGLFTRPDPGQGTVLRPPLPKMYQVPGLAHGTYRVFDIEVGDSIYTVYTRPGVFSWKRLDAGTRLLLSVLHVRPSDHVLDIGCGYGIIGMFAARHAIDGRVTMVDVDTLACECARASLAHNGFEHVQVLWGDGLAAVAGQRFTLIVSNPPFHSGYAVSFDAAEGFVRESYDALQPRGRLVLVANRFLPYNRLMARCFGQVTTLLQTPHYHVLSAQKNGRRAFPR